MADSTDQTDFGIPVRPHRIKFEYEDGEQVPGFTFAGHTDFYFEPTDAKSAGELTTTIGTVLDKEGEYEYSETEDGYFIVVDKEGDYSMFHAIAEPEGGLGPYVMVSCREATTEASVERFWKRLNLQGDFTFSKDVTVNVDDTTGDV